MGANLGEREVTLREAVRRLGELGEVAAVSSLYETEPVGYLDQPAFLNAVASVKTELPPHAIMRKLLAVEHDFGRLRTFPNAPRTLDLDLLLLGHTLLESEEVRLPHPRLRERAFVLIPLAEIGPDVVHPLLDQTIQELFIALPPNPGVRLYAPAGWHVTR